MMQSVSDKVPTTEGKGFWTVFIVLNVMVIGAGPANAQAQNLTEMSIEKLMNIQVTSVSKKAQPFSASAAAIFVITKDDLRKSGVTRLTFSTISGWVNGTPSSGGYAIFAPITNSATHRSSSLSPFKDVNATMWA